MRDPSDSRACNWSENFSAHDFANQLLNYYQNFRSFVKRIYFFFFGYYGNVNEYLR